MTKRREARPEPSPHSFQEYLASRNLSGARLACLLVAALMPTGLGLDWTSQPDKAQEFLNLRLVASALCLGVLALTYVDWGKKWAFALGMIPAFIAAVTIQAMIERLDGYASPYYAGLNLCILGLGLVFTWRGWRTAIVCGGIVAIWLIPALRGGRPLDGGIFFNNLYFLVLTSVIAVASNARRYGQAKREFEANGRLATTTLELGTALERLKAGRPAQVPVLRQHHPRAAHAAHHDPGAAGEHAGRGLRRSDRRPSGRTWRPTGATASGCSS